MPLKGYTQQGTQNGVKNRLIVRNEKRSVSRKEKLENRDIGFGCPAKESLASEKGHHSKRVAFLFLCCPTKYRARFAYITYILHILHICCMYYIYFVMIGMYDLRNSLQAMKSCTFLNQHLSNSREVMSKDKLCCTCCKCLIKSFTGREKCFGSSLL